MLITKFSIIRPCEVNRLDLLNKTMPRLLEQLEGFEYEIIVPTTTITTELDHIKNLVVIKYQYPFPHFNPAKAWNLGIKCARYKDIIFMSPEIDLEEGVMTKLSETNSNVVCQVFDLSQNGTIAGSLVNTNYRNQTPSMFFLAMFKKSDLESINGFDEEFCGGYAYEDDDFGRRWVSSGLKFEVKDDIKAYHLWHSRHPLAIDGWRNQNLFINNKRNNIIVPKKGLRYYE